MARRKRRSTYKTYSRRNFFLRFRVPLIIIGILLVAGAAFAVYHFFFASKPEESLIEAGYEEMDTPTLPVVYTEYEGRQVNPLFGYIGEMDTNYIRDCMYVLQGDYDIPLVIDTFGRGIAAISFKLTDPETGNLIQSGDITEYRSKEGVISCVMQLDNIIEEDHDYIADIILTDPSSRTINYYLRVKHDAEAMLSEQMEMAVYFNSCIYNSSDSEARSYLSKYMQPDSLKEAGRSYGYANLNSSTSHITWGRMSVTGPEDVTIQILDSDGDIGYFRLNYTISRQVNEVTEYYRVSDYYRIRVTDGYHYPVIIRHPVVFSYFVDLTGNGVVQPEIADIPV